MEDLHVYDGIMDGLKEALAYTQGDRSGCRVSVREVLVPEYGATDVARTRKSLHLSQRGLASALGVSVRTVEAWDAGGNTPSGAARNLLYLLDNDHALVDRLITR